VLKPDGSTSWPKGANNVAPRDRLPDGFFRVATNVDPMPAGTLSLRAGYEKVYNGTDVRGVLALGDKVLIADGTSLVEYNAVTNSSRVVRTIAGAGRFVGEVMDEVLYFCTENECLEYDGTTVRPWGVPDGSNSFGVTAGTGGGLQAGHYQMAVTYTDAWGREGGAAKPKIITVAQGGSLAIQLPAPPAGCSTNLYVGTAYGATMYLQNNYGTAAAVTLTLVSDNTARCTTELLRRPTPCDYMVQFNGVMVTANGPYVQMTRPMQPHLVDTVRGMLQYGAPVNGLLATDYLYVCADQCYVLTGVETDGIRQQVVLSYPAITGTAIMLPDGRGAWMTHKGQVFTASDRDGYVAEVTKDSFVPPPASAGSVGVIDHNGNQLVVTSLKNKAGGNPLAASDFYIGEIINP